MSDRKSYIQCVKESWRAFYDSAPSWDWSDVRDAFNMLAAIFLIVFFKLLSPLLVLIGGAIRYRRQFKSCDHARATSRKWLDTDRTPMVETRCPDCGYHDHGHVYADPETYLTE